MWFTHGLLTIWTELLSIFFGWSAHMRRELGTQITPWGWIIWTMILYNLKNYSQDLSNEGSNFILSSLEVGHWVAQLFFDKLPEITNFGLLQQSQNRTRLWICQVLTKGLDSVKIDHDITFSMPKKVFS